MKTIQILRLILFLLVQNCHIIMLAILFMKHLILMHVFNTVAESFMYTLYSIYTVSVNVKFHLRHIWIWSHSSIYALISPLFTLFLVKIYSIILFTRFSNCTVFPGKQKMRKRRRDLVYIPDHFCIFSFQVMLWWTIPSSSTVNWNTVKTEVAIQLTQWSYI